MSSSKGNSAAPIDGVPHQAETESIATEPDAVEATSEAGPAQDGRGCDEEPHVSSSGPDAVNPTEEAMEPDPLECLRADLAKTRDQLLRTAADFDNYRKRSRREIIDSDRQGRESVLRELLPVFDNLERAVAHAETSTDTKSVADGVQLVVQQFLDTIAKIGVERLQSLGQPFDPSLHDAIQSLETTEFPAGTIAAEILPGYKMGDRLVRPALVVVAKRPAETPPASGPNDGGSTGKDSDPPE